MRTNKQKKLKPGCLKLLAILGSCFCLFLNNQTQNQVLANKIAEKNFRRLVGFENLPENKIIVIDLKSALRMALEKNLDLQIQKYNLKEEKYKLLKSTAKFLPDLNLVNSFIRTKGNIQFTGDELLAIENESYRGGANFSFGLFRGGKILFGWLASQKNFEKEKKIFNTKEQEILTEAIISYFKLQANLAQIKSGLSRIEKAQANLSNRKIALEAGIDIGLNVLLAEQELESAKSSLAVLKGRFYIESINLSKILNIELGTVLVPFEINEQQLLKFGKEPVKYYASKLTKLALANNPQILAENLNYQSAKFEKKAIIGDFFPTLSIQANLGYLGSEPRRIKENNQYSLRADYDLTSLGSKKILDFLQYSDFLEKNRIKLKQKISEIASKALSLFFEINAKQKAYLASKKALSVSEKAYEQAEARLKAGLSNPYELKVAQSDLELIRSNYYETLVDFKISEINLLQAIGLVSIENLTNGLQI